MKLDDNTWQFITDKYFGFLYTEDLDRFADAWEQSELAKIQFLQEIT